MHSLQAFNPSLDYFSAWLFQIELKSPHTWRLHWWTGTEKWIKMLHKWKKSFFDFTFRQSAQSKLNSPQENSKRVEVICCEKSISCGNKKLETDKRKKTGRTHPPIQFRIHRCIDSFVNANQSLFAFLCCWSGGMKNNNNHGDIINVRFKVCYSHHDGISQIGVIASQNHKTEQK